MKYLECAIKEALRIYPSVTNVYKKMRRTIPNRWSHPSLLEQWCKRRPYFLTSRSRSIPFAYAPFSAGPRNCIGQKFALAEEKIIIGNILRRFTIKSLDQRDQVEIATEIVLRPRSGLRIKFTPR
ncbi:hypothetical protein MTO96_038338 [Rhipicephalus appendiculatus]